jgi:SAM-dependent methyltransferase
MTHAEKVAQWMGAGKMGVEVGAGGKPVPGLEPPAIQVDCFKAFGADLCAADFYGHACALPFHDHALDYVIASHVLEHVANPVAALVEWYRVVRPGGIVYLIVPNRLATFDRSRELTPVEHLLADFEQGTTACDATHIDDFALGLDWALYQPGIAPEEIPARRVDFARGLHDAVARGEEINIHFHTFEPANLRELLETLARPPVRPELPRLQWEIVDLIDGFPAASPNGVLAVLRVHKGWRARADAEVFRLRTGGDPRAVLRADAEPFAGWAERTTGLGGVNRTS